MPVIDPGAGSGGGGDGGDDGGGGGGGGDGPLGFGAIAPDFLTNNIGLLRQFVTNPRRFVIGAVATTILESVFGVVTLLVDAILLLFAGSDPSTFDAPDETLGLVDVPVAAANLVADAIRPTILGDLSPADAVLNGISAFNEPIFAAASIAGPFSPIVITAIVVGEVILALLLARRAVYVIADFAQLGGLTE